MVASGPLDLLSSLIIVKQVLIRLIIRQAANHPRIVRVLLVETLVVGQRDFQVLVELLQNYLVEEGQRLLWLCLDERAAGPATLLRLENIEVASERDEVAFELCSDLLPLAPSAVAVTCAMMTVPAFVANNIIQTLIKVRLEAESAELALAFVFDGLLLPGLAC